MLEKSAYTRAAQAREQIRKFADQPNGDDGLAVWHLATAYRTVGREKKQAGTGGQRQLYVPGVAVDIKLS